MKGGLLSTLGKLLFPTRCLLCGTVGLENVCLNCEARLEVIQQPCLRCGRRRQTAWASPDCGECHTASLGVARARSKYVYNAAGRNLLAEFKFNRREAAGAWLAHELASYAQAAVEHLDVLAGCKPSLVVPVPIHPQRHRERGFNQAETMARAAAAALGMPCVAGMLVRTRPTPSQVGLTAAQRKVNVRGAFAVPKDAAPRLSGQCVLLVDDLMTTGATLRACALALRQGGGGAAIGLTVFSTVHDVESSDTIVPPPRTWL